MFTAALFIAAKTWNQPKCTSAKGWIKLMQYIRKMEYCSGAKTEIRPFAATRRDLENIILIQVSQTEKDKYHGISFKCGI